MINITVIIVVGKFQGGGGQSEGISLVLCPDSLSHVEKSLMKCVFNFGSKCSCIAQYHNITVRTSIIIRMCTAKLLALLKL